MSFCVISCVIILQKHMPKIHHFCRITVDTDIYRETQWSSARLELERLLVKYSPEALFCVSEQGTLLSA